METADMLQKLEIRHNEECISDTSNGKSRDFQSMSSSKADIIVEVEKISFDPTMTAGFWWRKICENNKRKL